MARKIIIAVFISIALFSFEHTENKAGDDGGDPFFTKGFNADLHEMDYKEISKYFSNNIYFDALLHLGVIRQGVPYKWGGNSWKKGIDCSHFTWKIFNEVGLYYNNFKVTEDLKSIVDSDGLYEVPVSDMKPGDLLVYGYYDNNKKWHGHVVILIDPNFVSRRKYKGLVLGSQSGNLGVSFISYWGFPKKYRAFWYRLRKVLRVKGLNY